MPKYVLYRLAAGSYDLALHGTIVGSVVREISPGGDVRGWRAELLDDVPAEQRPAPFTAIEHPFRTLEAVTAWLGGATVFEDCQAS